MGHCRRRLMSLVGVIALGVPAAAEEMRIRDLRLEWTPVFQGDVDITGTLDQDAPGISESGFEDQALRISSHQRVGLSYVHGVHELEADRGSFLLGAFVAYDRITAKDGSRGTTPMIGVLAGWAWALTPRWHIEQGLQFAAGYSDWTLVRPDGHLDGTSQKLESDGMTMDYGPRVGTTYCWRDFVLAADVKYLLSRSSQDFTETYTGGAGRETTRWSTTIRTEMLAVTVSLGYRF